MSKSGTNGLIKIDKIKRKGTEIGKLKIKLGQIQTEIDKVKDK